MANKFGLSIANYSISDLGKILITYDIPFLPYVWHLWFILPYFLISISIGLQDKLLSKIHPCIYLLVNLILCLAIFNCKQNTIFVPYWLKCINFIQTLIVYNFFYIMGVVFYKKIDKRILFILPFVAFACFYIWGGLHIDNMQAHKFPPDITFMTYNFFVLSLLFILCSYINLPNNKLIQLWNSNGYTIYLYQNFVFAFFYLILLKWIDLIGNTSIKFAVSIICVFILSTLSNYIIQPLEKSIIRCLNRVNVVYKTKFKK